MGLDVTKLRSMNAEIKKRAGGNDNLFVYANKLGEAEDIRILEGRENLNGTYMMYQEGWWVGGKFYPTAGSFGLNDVINDEVERAKLSKDEDIKALLKAKSPNGAQMLKKESRYFVPILHLDCKYDKNDYLESFSVIDGICKVLVCKPTLLLAINEIVSSRHYHNNTEFGICDRKKGWNITIGKTGKGLDTTYNAVGWTQPTEMEDKYYGEAVPDVYEMVKKSVKSDEYLRSVIRNYLYGEEILEIEEDVKEEKTEEANEEVETKKDAPKRATMQTTKTEPAKEEKAGKPIETGGRNLLDDAVSALANLDD